MTCQPWRARGVDKRTRHPGQEAADCRHGTLTHDRPVQPGASPAGLRPVRSGQGERRDLVPGRDQHQVGIQGREQLAVSRDGLPLQRDMGAVICSRQGIQAGPGQPGQASRRASHLHQAGDALAIGHFGGPQQDLVLARILSRPRAARKLASSRTRSPTTIWSVTAPVHGSGGGPGQRSQVLSGHAEGQEDSGRNTSRRKDDPDRGRPQPVTTGYRRCLVDAIATTRRSSRVVMAHDGTPSSSKRGGSASSPRPGPWREQWVLLSLCPPKRAAIQRLQPHPLQPPGRDRRLASAQSVSPGSPGRRSLSPC